MRRFGLPLAEIAEPVDGPWAKQLREIAEQHQLVVAAGMFSPSADGRVNNTLRAVGPGVDAHYHKIHLFDAFGFRESETVAPGAEPVVITVGEAKVGLTMLLRRQVSWLVHPTRRAGSAGDLCCRILGCRPGQGRTVAVADPSSCAGLHLVRGGGCAGGPSARCPRQAPTGVGYSAVISPRGEVLQSLGSEPGLLVADLDLDVVDEARSAIPVLANRRI